MDVKGAGAGKARPVRSVGFVGLGPWGCPMAMRLAQAGFRLRLYDADPAVRARAGAMAGHVAVAADPGDAAEGADAVVTALPSGIEVRDAVLGGGIADRLGIGGILVDASSSSPWLTRRLADDLRDSGISMIDAAVTGMLEGSDSGARAFMVGGAPAVVARARPLLEAMGGQVCHVGGIGAGHAAKAVCTLMAAMREMVTAEAFGIGVTYGLDATALAEAIALAGGIGRRAANSVEHGALACGLERGADLDRVSREMSVALELARGLGLELPLAEAGAERLRLAFEALGADSDAAALARWVEARAGVRALS